MAALARWSGDLTEAFAEALRVWPRDGVPDNPGGWLLTVARNRARDRLRRESARPGKELGAVVDEIEAIQARTERADVHPVRDDELRMMFTCAHPALDQVPPAELLPERTPHVLGCIYSVFAEGYWATAGPSAIRDELCDERLRLAEGSIGPYLPQAVIAALHATAPNWEQTDWTTICTAYDRLLATTDSPVVRANHALAVGFRDGYVAGLAAVTDDPRLAHSSLVPSIRADLLRRDGRPAEALPSYRQALAVTGSDPARAFLQRRIAECV